MRSSARTAIGVALGLAVGVAFGLAAALSLETPAAAEITSDTIGCSGEARVTGDDGTVADIDLTDTSVKIPRADIVQWRGSTNKVTHNHSGAVDLQLGPFSVKLGEWGPTANADNGSTFAGVIDLPAIVRQFPSVEWKVTGSHVGTEGQCAGEITFEMEGSAASTAAAGVAALAGTVAAGAAFVQAARPRTKAPGGMYR